MQASFGIDLRPPKSLTELSAVMTAASKERLTASPNVNISILRGLTSMAAEKLSGNHPGSRKFADSSTADI
jgi:hypothetical protein